MAAGPCVPLGGVCNANTVPCCGGAGVFAPAIGAKDLLSCSGGICQCNTVPGGGAICGTGPNQACCGPGQCCTTAANGFAACVAGSACGGICCPTGLLGGAACVGGQCICAETGEPICSKRPDSWGMLRFWPAVLHRGRLCRPVLPVATQCAQGQCLCGGGGSFSPVDRAENLINQLLAAARGQGVPQYLQSGHDRLRHAQRLLYSREHDLR